MIDRADVKAAETLIRPHVRETPIIKLDGTDLNLRGTPITLKLELMQYAGSFKVRGAFTNLLTRDIPPAGVVAASGGNHGAAVAFAAAKLGVTARIFVPSVASKAKIAQIRSYGAELVIEGNRYADALRASEAWIAHSGAMSVHAYDSQETLLGQATTGLELENQAPALDTVLASVGGGGFIGGIAGWYAGRAKVIGVEPELAPTLHDALAAGQPVDSPAGGIAADSLAPRRIGELMFPIAQHYIDRVVLVSDEHIRAAQEILWTTLRIVAEPGGAAAFAALASGRYVPQSGERIGVMVCGANTVAVDFGR